MLALDVGDRRLVGDHALKTLPVPAADQYRLIRLDGDRVQGTHAHQRGGFALQRTRPGEKAQWLLVKRRDEEARPGWDVVADAPRSVVSGRTLTEVLAHGEPR